MLHSGSPKRDVAILSALSVAVGLALGASASAAPAAQAGDRKNDPQSDLPADLEVPPAPALDASAEHATFAVPPGFEVQLVAAEPLTVDPIQLTFDEQGRLWVVEMQAYMQDADGRDELEPICTIAILTDTDGDGTMDERSLFAENLVLPRGVAPMHGGALCILPPELVFLRDDDGDGKFDTREVVATGLRQGLNNPEHAINSPTVGIDNWVHFANWNKIVRRVFDEEGEPSWETRSVRGGGQWGLSMDELGRALRNTNPNPLYMDVVPSRYGVRNRHQRGFKGNFTGVGAKNEVFPSRINPGVNRGYQERTLRDDFTLHFFTAACAPTALKGDGLGKEVRGDIFVAEPSGNLIKRYRMESSSKEAAPKATSVHAKTDFMTSTDERFRPVAMTTGPDGALYIADLYRGILQHRVFMTTFLRKQVEARGLDTPLGQGRIWRIVKAGTSPKPPVGPGELLDASLAELVSSLSSDNAWIRQSSQQIIVEDFDGEASVVGALRDTVVSGPRPLGRIHALWTLAGIGFADEETVGAALADKDARVRAAALQVAEPMLDLEGNELFGAVMPMATEESNARTRLHALLALGASDKHEVLTVLGNRMTLDASSGLERSAVVSGLEYREAAFLIQLAERPEWQQAAPGRAELFKQLAGCVGREGLSENLERIVDLALERSGTWMSRPLLEGLFSTRKKGPKGERLPIPLRAMPVALSVPANEPKSVLAKLASDIDEGCTWPGKPGAVEIELPRELTEAEMAQYAHGAAVFATTCATCHQSHGGGQDGKAPTLRGTKYAVGDEARLARILIHGLEGPLEIDGQTWNMEMPRFEGSDEDLAAVLTFVRRSWGNGADPVTVKTVVAERAAAGGRTRALTAAELK